MSQHSATIEWSRGAQPFTDGRYSRAHQWRFDGGAVVAASSSPHVVPVPLSDAANVDPEEAYVAALSSCHMLWFLGMAAEEGYCVDSYSDAAVGHMSHTADGRQWIGRVELRPSVVFSGARQPDAAELARLHHRAHASCFIANSVRTEVTVHAR